MRTTATLLALALPAVAATKGVVTLDDLTFDKVRQQRRSISERSAGTELRLPSCRRPLTLRLPPCRRSSRDPHLYSSSSTSSTRVSITTPRPPADPECQRASRLAADGDGEDCFKETAEKVGELKTNLIVAEVGKQEYGDEENKALHERFNIDKDAWPVYKLFPKVSPTSRRALPGVWSHVRVARRAAATRSTARPSRRARRTSRRPRSAPSSRSTPASASSSARDRSALSMTSQRSSWVRAAPPPFPPSAPAVTLL